MSMSHDLGPQLSVCAIGKETHISYQVPGYLSNIMCTEEKVGAMLQLHSLDTAKVNANDEISARMLKETAASIYCSFCNKTF